MRKKKESSGSLYPAPCSIVIIVKAAPLVRAALLKVGDSRPHSTNEEDADEHHASKCADHLQVIRND